MGAYQDLHRYRLFQHHDAGTAFRYFMFATAQK